MTTPPSVIEAGAMSLYAAQDFGAFERDWEMLPEEGKRLWRLNAEHCYLVMREAERRATPAGGEEMARVLHAEMVAIEHDHGGETCSFEEMTPEQRDMIDRMARAAIAALATPSPVEEGLRETMQALEMAEVRRQSTTGVHSFTDSEFLAVHRTIEALAGVLGLRDGL